MKAQLGAPLGKGHPQFTAEETGEGAITGSDPPAEFEEGAVIGGVVAQDVVQGTQQRRGGRRQIERRFRGGAQLVQEDRAQPVALGASVVGGVGVGDDQFAQQGADRQDGG